MLGLALWLAPVATPPRSPSTSSNFLAIWLCTIAGIGCPGAQVKPPEPEDCSQEATRAMFQELKVREASDLRAVVDISQPSEQFDAGVYQDGPVVGRLTRGDGNLPVGTLLHGRLWTGPGVYEINAYAGKRVWATRMTGWWVRRKAPSPAPP